MTERAGDPSDLAWWQANRECMGLSPVVATGAPPPDPEPPKPDDGTLAPGEVVWWFRESDNYRGVSVGPPAAGDVTYIVDWGDGNGPAFSAYSPGAPLNAVASTATLPVGSWDSVLYADDGAGSAGAVVSTHTFVVAAT